MNAETAAILSAYYAWISDLVVAGHFCSPEQAADPEKSPAPVPWRHFACSNRGKKALLIQFLYDAGLIVLQSDKKEPALIPLNGADLRDLDCSQAQMDGLCIISAYLNNANFSRTFLYQANLSACDLIQADLSLLLWMKPIS